MWGTAACRHYIHRRALGRTSKRKDIGLNLKAIHCLLRKPVGRRSWLVQQLEHVFKDEAMATLPTTNLRILFLSSTLLPWRFQRGNRSWKGQLGYSFRPWAVFSTLSCQGGKWKLESHDLGPMHPVAAMRTVRRNQLRVSTAHTNCVVFISWSLSIPLPPKKQSAKRWFNGDSHNCFRGQKEVRTAHSNP